MKSGDADFLKYKWLNDNLNWIIKDPTTLKPSKMKEQYESED